MGRFSGPLDGVFEGHSLFLRDLDKARHDSDARLTVNDLACDK